MAAARRDPGPRGPAALRARARAPAGYVGPGPRQAAATRPPRPALGRYALGRRALERYALGRPAPRGTAQGDGVADWAAAAAEPASLAGPGPADGGAGFRGQGEAGPLAVVDGLDVVAVGVAQVDAVVAGVVLRPLARGVQHFRPGRRGGVVHRVHRIAVGRPEGHV